MAKVSGTSRARLATALLVAIAGACTLPAQTPKITEYQVKTAYLTNFGRFVEWPARAALASGQSFNICVLGPDPFGADLDNAVAGETIGRAQIVAKRISQPQDAADCRIVFIAASELGQWKEIQMALGTLNVLTVSDMPQFAQRGGMIQFLRDGNKVRFDINLAATHRAGLNLSSELLKVAVTVNKLP